MIGALVFLTNGVRFVGGIELEEEKITYIKWGFIPSNLKNSYMRVLVVCVWMCCGLSVQGQSLKSLGVGSGMQVFAERDRAFSPLLYRGQRSVFNLNYTQEEKSKTMLSTIYYARGFAESAGENELELWTGGAQWHTYYHQQGNVPLRLGWSAVSEFNKRRHEGFANFNERSDFTISLGPALSFALPFRLVKSHLHLEGSAHLQVVGFKVASDFISPEPRRRGIDSEQHFWGFLDILDPFIVPRDLRMGLDTSLVYQFSSGNALAFRYAFDFQQLRLAHSLQRGRGNYGLVLHVRL
ncbi:MAG: hypothetical protein JJU34_16105 [Lunatimonas sp.]|uniref:hypothetical protein n=1 Tax=Lunatimonas sp. TaxID=2060141 RepID=UPI00263B0940|nr:hypothetical protein [Lunatimonas sp.]MCC5938804.1 hypothetical protein [Lunatimonas sp.]